MHHLEICLLTDLPTTGAYFSFQLTFKIIVFLSGSGSQYKEIKVYGNISVTLRFAV